MVPANFHDPPRHRQRRHATTQTHTHAWSRYRGFPLSWKVVCCTVNHFWAKIQLLTNLSARELTLDAATAARNSRGSTKTMPTAQVKKLLDSRNEREVLEGLKRAVSVSNVVGAHIHGAY